MYKEIEPTNIIYSLAYNLRLGENLRYYLDRYTNFDWGNIFILIDDIIPIENSDEAETVHLFKILDIKNIKDKDLVSIVKTLTKTHNPFIFDYNFIIKNEIYRLNYLIDNHIDNYNECSLTGNVRPSHLRSLINVLEEIDKKLSTVSGIKTELYHSEDQNLH
jgi:hypothetical protein